MAPWTLLVGRLRSLFERDTKGEAIFPLAVLSALYFFDEFDTAAFATLAPDIQRSFDLTDEKFIGLVIINASLVVLLAVPVGYLADRVNRVHLVVISGILAGSFSLVTGLVSSVALLTFARFGNGVGVLANIPIHNSLLSDYYTPDSRPTVFANHTNALYLGAIFGPAVAGVAGAAFGWRAAFFICFIPIIITTVIATRLVEPARGSTDRPDGLLPMGGPPPGFRAACKTLWGVHTLRRTFWASIFLGAGLLPLAAYLPLFFEREYGLGPFERGVIGAANAAVTFVGVQRGGRLTPAWFAKGMQVPMQRTGLVLAAVGPGLLLIVASPWLAGSVAFSLLTSYFVGYLFAPLAAVQALVSPARERSLSFSLGAVFLVAGVILFFITGLGGVSDAHGLRWALAVLAPFWIIGGAIAASAGQFVERDVQLAFAAASGPPPDASPEPPAGPDASTDLPPDRAAEPTPD